MAISTISYIDNSESIDALTRVAISGSLDRQLTDLERDVAAYDDFWTWRMVSWLGVHPVSSEHVYLQFAAMLQERRSMMERFVKEQRSDERVSLPVSEPAERKISLFQAVRGGHDISAHILLVCQNQTEDCVGELESSLERVAQITHQDQMAASLRAWRGVVDEDDSWASRIDNAFGCQPVSQENVDLQYLAMTAMRKRDIELALQELQRPQCLVTSILRCENGKDLRRYRLASISLGFEFSMSCILSAYKLQGREVARAVEDGRWEMLGLFATLPDGEVVWPLFE